MESWEGSMYVGFIADRVTLCFCLFSLKFASRKSKKRLKIIVVWWREAEINLHQPLNSPVYYLEQVI